MKSSSSGLIVLGTNCFLGDFDGVRRQEVATASWRKLPDVKLINLAFEDGSEIMNVEGFRTVATLKLYSIKVSGIAGRRKPIVSEMFAELAQTAIDEGCEYFAFSNNDITIPGEFVRVVRSSSLDALIFSRRDFDRATGADCGIVTTGQDLFVVRASWWTQNHWRFRPYIVGESGWDNAYTAILLRHASAALYNREVLIEHERHPMAWHNSPFRIYNDYLLKLDGLYFAAWVAYWNALDAARRAGASVGEECKLQERFLGQSPTAGQRLKHLARMLRAEAFASTQRRRTGIRWSGRPQHL